MRHACDYAIPRCIRKAASRTANIEDRIWVAYYSAPSGWLADILDLGQVIGKFRTVASPLVAD